MPEQQSEVPSQNKQTNKKSHQRKNNLHTQKLQKRGTMMYNCNILRQQITEKKTNKQNFESKEPLIPQPPEWLGLQA
uniref:Uncharacterized protein n=1 Tax=Callithrix jacchus TaxID=9483 RepID=A0A5F4VXE5_CALJA